MRGCKGIVICVWLICALFYFSGILAQEQPPQKPPETLTETPTETPPETPKAPPPSQVYLKDSTFVVGEIKMDNLKVTTDYGVLTVPKNQIIKITIGKNADKELKKKIDDLVKQLGDSEFKLREDATKELTTLGSVALAELREATKSEDVEVKTRAEKLVRQIEQSTSSEEEVIDDDEVQTAKFTIRGTAEIESIEVTTPHGVLKVPKKEIKSIVVGEATLQSKTVTVDASYWVPGAMMDSQVDVKKGDTITMTASGSIYIRSWSMNVSPDGDPNNTYMSNLPMGALTGKIGQNGPLFKIGASYKGTADRDGRIFLGTAARERSGNTGEFKVKITVEK